MNKVKLACVVSHPIQYHAPLYRQLAQSSAIELTVLFMSQHGLQSSYDSGFGTAIAFDTPLLGGYEHRFLPNMSPFRDVSRFGGLFNPALLSTLRRSSYDVVWIHGYAHASDWLAFLVCSSRGLPILLRGESRLATEAGLPTVRWVVKRLLLGALFRQVRYCLAIGIENEAFYEAYGVSPERIIRAPYAVDNESFRSAGAEGRERRSEMLEDVGLDPLLPTVLFAAKLQPWKRPQDAIELARRLPTSLNILIGGDGPMLSGLRDAARELPNVRFLGFINQSRIGHWYGVADFFLLPSAHEPWGLAVNEAMAAGAVPVVSSAVGCAPDLIGEDGGIIFPVGDIGTLAALIARMTRDEGAYARAQKRGAARVDLYDIKQAAGGVETAALAAVGAR